MSDYIGNNQQQVSHEVSYTVECDSHVLADKAIKTLRKIRQGKSIDEEISFPCARNYKYIVRVIRLESKRMHV